MLNRFFQNTRKPKGVLGRMMLRGMNTGHSKLAAWGFSFLPVKKGDHILDIGCGGGANIAKMLKDFPSSTVDGIDYSKESVLFSRKTNAHELGRRCTIRQGNVMSLPYPDQSIDVVTAFETIYFWPDLDKAFSEVRRVLKPDGIFFICCESDDSSDSTWTSRIEGMTVYGSEDIKNRLTKTGFGGIQLRRNKNGWVCIKGVR
ncbi:MAG: class I SAM-dependent methyltransferase [Muricomes sp.]